MPIHVVCPTCQVKINAPAKAAGKRVKCPKCGEPLLVPSATGPTPDWMQDAPPATTPRRPRVPNPAKVDVEDLAAGILSDQGEDDADSQEPSEEEQVPSATGPTPDWTLDSLPATPRKRPRAPRVDDSEEFDDADAGDSFAVPQGDTVPPAVAPLRKDRMPAPPRMLVEGRSGQVELLENSILITRRGWLSTPKVGDKEILLSSITAIEFKPAGFLGKAGYIKFVYQGGGEIKKGFWQSADPVMRAATDENAVLFGKGQQPKFERLKRVLMDRLAAIGQSQPSRSTSVRRRPEDDAAWREPPTGQPSEEEQGVPFSCPSCKETYRVSEELAGKKIRCRRCGASAAVAGSKGGAVKPRQQRLLVGFLFAVCALSAIVCIAVLMNSGGRGKPANLIPYQVLKTTTRADNKVIMAVLVDETASKEDVMKLAESLWCRDDLDTLDIFDSRVAYDHSEVERRIGQSDGYPEEEMNRHWLIQGYGKADGIDEQFRWVAEGRDH